ncbi:MAG: (Fe-S)-binding protein [Anaerolineae bacterium]|nr:(Fe-S)-binding protein [Anaerolineae bacterium]
MLTLLEKILLTLLLLLSCGVAFVVVRRLVKIITSGRGKPDWSLVKKRLPGVLWKKWILLEPTWKMRLWTGVLHALVAWAFIFYLPVNVFNLIKAYDADFYIPGRMGDVYRLFVDLASLGVLLGICGLAIRRFVLKPANLAVHEPVLIHAKARSGIQRDSAMVMGLVTLHIVAHSLQQAADFARRYIAAAASQNTLLIPDLWQPLSSILAGIYLNLPLLRDNITVFEHAFFWLSMTAMLVFIPYFLYSKHVHLITAPLHYLLKPERLYTGELAKIDLDDETNSLLGAACLKDLGWHQLMDAYACVMCFRCQEVCPAYATGKALSPAALEINKRYFFNEQGADFANGKIPDKKLVDFLLTPEAVWACTACGACEEVCPVGNEPMHDILEIRRSLALVEDRYSPALRQVYRNLERTFNPWGMPAGERLSWAKGLDVPTIEKKPHPELLWWVGCAAAYDPRAQKAARAFARILNASQIDYAVLGNREQCTGDLARRSGREDIFFQLTQSNMALLNEVNPQRIVTTCPHCLQTLQNDYRDYGGNFQVIHHTRLINELLADGRLPLNPAVSDVPDKIAYHDPCYLSRFNGLVREPRQVLSHLGKEVAELPRHGAQSFCCGAGGAQAWKEEEQGRERIGSARMHEAQQAGMQTLTVACPFCLSMLSDASNELKNNITLRDIAELVDAQVGEK